LTDLGVEDVRITSIALPDEFIDHGKPALQHTKVGLTAEAIAKRTLDAVRIAPVPETARRPA
jgi:deoxyxylulose-5-phosphate synthase